MWWSIVRWVKVIRFYAKWCKKYKFSYNEFNIKIYCNQVNDKHANYLSKNPKIRGIQRLIAKHELCNQFVSNWRDNKLFNKSAVILSSDVARKIRSEAKDYHKDPFIDLYAMKNHKNWRYYVQYIAHPLEIYLCSKEQLALAFKNEKDLISRSNHTLFFDATGSVVKKINFESKCVFLYSLILHVKHNDKKGILFPIAEAFLSSHYFTDILCFLLYIKPFV